MSQYSKRVERQRQKIAAEDWAGKVKAVHAHSLSSMYYDTRPEDTEDSKSVLDVEYNSGKIERTLNNGEKYIFTDYELKGDELLSAFSQNNWYCVFTLTPSCGIMVQSNDKDKLWKKLKEVRWVL